MEPRGVRYSSCARRYASPRGRLRNVLQTRNSATAQQRATSNNTSSCRFFVSLCPVFCAVSSHDALPIPTSLNDHFNVLEDFRLRKEERRNNVFKLPFIVPPPQRYQNTHSESRKPLYRESQSSSSFQLTKIYRIYNKRESRSSSRTGGKL